MNSLIKEDLRRYEGGRGFPQFQKWLRRAQCSKGLIKAFCILMLRITRNKCFVEISHHNVIGGGLYIGHAFGITINPWTVIGDHCSIHKGVTIGQENRGVRKGVPTIGDKVWIGVNATVVGKIHVGNDVLIAPNTLVNCDVPDHSIVIGNPCKIIYRENATEGYL